MFIRTPPFSLPTALENSDMAESPKFVFVASTSGSVMNAVLATETVKKVTHSVVANCQCQALTRAREHGVQTNLIDEKDEKKFCTELLAYVEENDIDYIISFYTQFYSADFRAAMQDRIVNFHPSLLPAFKGMDGFGDGIAYHTKIIGTTVELIKDVMDEGKIVMQTACASDPSMTRDEMRHRIFNQQCKTLIQVVDWLTAERIEVYGDKIKVRGASFGDTEFAPELENPEAKSFFTPFPTAQRATATA